MYVYLHLKAFSCIITKRINLHVKLEEVEVDVDVEVDVVVM